MKTHDMFDISRLFKLIINDIRLQSKSILIFSLALLVFFLIMPFELTNSTDVYLMILYISGFIISSSAFRDLHNTQKAQFSLMLPCSNLERFLSRWFLTSIGYATALLVIYYIFILLQSVILLSMVNLDIYHQHIKLMNIFQISLWISIGKYIIFQSVILLGAIVFKKLSLIKTALILGCFFLVLNLFLAVIYYLFLSHDWIAVRTSYLTIKGGYFTLWLFAAPVFLYATYLRLIEFELR